MPAVLAQQGGQPAAPSACCSRRVLLSPAAPGACFSLGRRIERPFMLQLIRAIYLTMCLLCLLSMAGSLLLSAARWEAPQAPARAALGPPPSAGLRRLASQGLYMLCYTVIYTILCYNAHIMCFGPWPRTIFIYYILLEYILYYVLMHI